MLVLDPRLRLHTWLNRRQGLVGAQPTLLHLLLNDLLTSLNLLQNRLLYRYRDPLILCRLLVLPLLQGPHSGVLAAGEDQEGVPPVCEVEVLEEGVGLEAEEGVVFSHLEKVVISLVNELNVRLLVVTLMVHLSPCKQNILLPGMHTLNNIDRKHSQSMQMLNKLVHMDR